MPAPRPLDRSESIPRLILLHDELYFRGGGERILLRVAELAQSHAAIDLGLIWGRWPSVLDPSELALFDSVETFASPKRLRPATASAYRRSLRRLRSWLRERRATALLSFGFSSALRGALATRSSGLPTGWMCQDNFPLFRSAMAGAKQRAGLAVLRRAGTRIVCPSDAGAERFRAVGYPTSLISRIRNGVDCARFQPAAMTAAEKRRRRRRHGLPEGDLVAICTARIDPIKNHELMLRAVRHAAAQGVRVTLVCVGAAASREQAFADALRRRAVDLEVAEQVVWAGHQEDVRPWLSMADVALLASHAECAPLALVEAAAAGLPLVGSRVGGIPEIVLPGESGLLFEAGDALDCARQLVALALDPGQREKLAGGARDLARREFDAAALDARWSAFLAELLTPET